MIYAPALRRQGVSRWARSLSAALELTSASVFYSVASLRAPPTRGETLRFDTTVLALERLRTWLQEERVTHVAMESTGSYWIPVFNVLEEHFAIVLANPEEVKNRKGHKTDRNDAKHIADLLRHDHIRSSYIPPKPVRQLRDLTRRRVQLTQDATRERNRVQKLLEQSNVKIGNVLTGARGELVKTMSSTGGTR